MTGTILNAGGIVVGAIVGALRRKPMAPGTEAFFKVALAAFTVFYGLRLTWISLGDSAGHVLKQLVITVLALTLGRLTGRGLRLQEFSNRLGRSAKERIEAAGVGTADRLSDGFKACAILFCAAPLGILGSVQDGLTGYFQPLAIKAVMDGLATAGFVSLFGGGIGMAALPVLAFQGTITLICAQVLAPSLQARGLVESVNAAGGLLVFSVALVMLQLKKVALADYLPSLVYAPVMTFLFR